jgi:hypothetical protein
MIVHRTIVPPAEFASRSNASSAPPTLWIGCAYQTVRCFGIHSRISDSVRPSTVLAKRASNPPDPAKSPRSIAGYLRSMPFASPGAISSMESRESTHSGWRANRPNACRPSPDQTRPLFPCTTRSSCRIPPCDIESLAFKPAQTGGAFRRIPRQKLVSSCRVAETAKTSPCRPGCCGGSAGKIERAGEPLELSDAGLAKWQTRQI